MIKRYYFSTTINSNRFILNKVDCDLRTFQGLPALYQFFYGTRVWVDVGHGWTTAPNYYRMIMMMEVYENFVYSN